MCLKRQYSWDTPALIFFWCNFNVIGYRHHNHQYHNTQLACNRHLCHSMRAHTATSTFWRQTTTPWARSLPAVVPAAMVAATGDCRLLTLERNLNSKPSRAMANRMRGRGNMEPKRLETKKGWPVQKSHGTLEEKGITLDTNGNCGGEGSVSWECTW